MLTLHKPSKHEKRENGSPNCTFPPLLGQRIKQGVTRLLTDHHTTDRSVREYKIDSPVIIQCVTVLLLLAGFLWVFGAGRTQARAAAPTDQVSVVIELDDPPVATIYAQWQQRNQVQAAALAAATQAQLATVEAAQQRLLSALDRLGGQVIFRNQRVYNGIAVRVRADQLAVLSRLAGVKAIHPLLAKQPTNDQEVPLIGAPQLWQMANGNKLTGQGMRIAIIDTGLDYLHTDFGGPGTGYIENDPTKIGDVNGFPSVKVIGGYDFVGNDYDADPKNNTYHTQLAPDPDPMDCYPHGTSVAGTAAGYGVNLDGSTYHGAYDGSTPFAQLRIGPGVAPNAQLYALKVFGCHGSSEVVDQGIEWAVDPNQDGDLSDHVDVINMSLGSDYGSIYDTTALASDNAAAAGVLVVAAAGNAGDNHYINSSPAVSNHVLSVAASQSVFQATHTPATLRYEGMAAFSSRGPRRFDSALKPDITAPGVDIFTASFGTGNGGRTISGTSLATPFVTGGMTLLRQLHPTWSLVELKALAMNTALTQLRTDSAITATLYSPPRIGAGRIDLIKAQQTQVVAYNADDADLVSVSFGAPEVVTTTRASKTVNVVNQGNQRATYTAQYVSITDLPGVTISLPTTTITAPAGGLAQLTVQMSADAAQIQRQRDPTLSATQLGLARHWISEESGYLLLWPQPLTFTVPLSTNVISVASGMQGSTVFRYSPTTTLLSYTVELHQLTSPITQITIDQGQGIGTSSNLAYALFNGDGSLTDPLTVSGAIQLKASDVQRLLNDLLFINIATEDQPTGAVRAQLHLATPVLKVPIYAAPRPIALMRAVAQNFDFASQLQVTVPVTLSGRGLTTTNPLTGLNSLVTLAELHTISPRLTITDPQGLLAHTGHADLKYVGVTSNVPALQSAGHAQGAVAASTIYFAIATYVPWNTPKEVEFDIYIDVDQDGKDDYLLFNSDQGGYNDGNPSDVFITALKNLQAINNPIIHQEYLNGLSPAQLDAGLFNANIMVLPVRASALGLNDTHTTFRYTVKSVSADVLYLPDGQRRIIDQTTSHFYNVAQPGLSFAGGLTQSSRSSAGVDASAAQMVAYADVPGQVITMHYNLAGFSSAEAIGLLLLHHQNGAGTQEEILSIHGHWPSHLYLPVIAR